MAAYLVVNVSVKDPKRYEDYKAIVPPSIAKYGGKYLARGGRTELLEGDWQPNRMVILEFPSMEKAKEWWGSADYAQAKAVRQSCSYTELVAVEGL